MNRARARLNIVFAVCHADDEAIWIGALLHGLGLAPDVEASVVCFSGGAVRSAEFDQARAIAGYGRGVVLDLDLRPAPEPLPDTRSLLEQGLGMLALEPSQIDLLVTHAPYGDEHLNPHHRQAHRELRRWSRARNVPFGWFTTLPSPYLSHVSLARTASRLGPLHLTELARCRPTLAGRTLGRDARLLGTSRYYVQFAGDAIVKRAMLEAYASVDQHTFHDGYAMYTSPVEGLYLADRRGLETIRAIISTMDVPHPTDLFEQATLRLRVTVRLRQLGSRAKRRLRGRG